jgi:dipeptidyl aminopeptidase/acylaminoacyl peptidase
VLACDAGRPNPATTGGTGQPQGLAQGTSPFAQRRLSKQLTDLAYFVQLGDEMIVRKVRYAGADDMIIPAYLFAPRDTTSKRPVILLVHGGFHGDFDIFYLPKVRSLVHRGYVVIGPDYRGSTGYSRAFYDAIDYGGKEVEDVLAAIDYLGALIPYADTSRIGIVGRSHGGLIALHAVLRQPDRFRVAVTHAPVSDLPARIRARAPAYEQMFVEQPAFGARLDDAPQRYIERSPVAHARRLRVPLLVQAADNDADVLIQENRTLRDSMRAAGKDKEGLFTYREWHNPPGGHAFTRVDTPEAREAWSQTVEFLDQYLGPAAP